MANTRKGGASCCCFRLASADSDPYNTSVPTSARLHSRSDAWIIGQQALSMKHAGADFTAPDTSKAARWRNRLGFRSRTSLARSLIAVFRSLRVDVWKVEGTEKWSGLPVSMLCAANRLEKAYLLRLVTRDSVRETLLGRKWIWNVATLPQASDCSLVVLAAQRRLVRFLHRKASFLIPAWVEMELELPADKLVKKTSVESDLRRIRIG